LVIARTKIDLREDFGISQLIEKNIDSRKRVFVLRTFSSYHLSS
jgi:hypothetical protein